MRAISAYFTVLLSLGAACAQVACSSDASSGAPGGAGDAGATNSGSSVAGSSGSGGSSGSSGSVSTGGDAGACAFDSSACNDCLTQHCTTEGAACVGDPTCSGQLTTLDACACDPSETTEACESNFVAKGGSKATPLVECFVEFCMAACQ